MTRHEANKLTSNLVPHEIDIIFDDIESVVCENCKYLACPPEGYWCTNGVSDSVMHDGAVIINPSVFGCNNFVMVSHNEQ